MSKETLKQLYIQKKATYDAWNDALIHIPHEYETLFELEIAKDIAELKYEQAHEAFLVSGGLKNGQPALRSFAPPSLARKSGG